MREDDILAWANEKVSNLNKPIITSFDDRSLRNSLYLINLISAVEPRVVYWDLVTNGGTNKERLLNARYCLSLARRLGASIFLLAEDIVEMNQSSRTKIMAFVAAVMQVDRSGTE